MSHNSPGTHGNKLQSLDPRLHKEVIKENITIRILEQIAGTEHDEIYRHVSEDYERLLESATVIMHIPVLVEGGVRSSERRRQFRRQFDTGPPS